MNCRNCGGIIIGDGITVAFHCENSNPKDYEHLEPDANLVECYKCGCCNGTGKIPSDHPDHEFETCMTCNGMG